MVEGPNPQNNNIGENIMKTLIETGTNISKYVFENADAVTITDNSVETSAFVIADLNSSNCSMVTGVTPPADWTGCKYTYANSSWTLNPDYVEPEEEEEI